MGAADKAFVSSTFEDLKAHRAFVIDALRGAGIFVDPMEDWTAEPDEPKRFSVERLDGCDLCVLLVALRRGFVPPGETHSITQLEYQAAIDRGIDVLVFMLDENAPWPRRFDGLDDDLKQWRQQLETRHGRSLFGLDPHSIQIERALTRWVTRQKRKITEVGSDWVQLVSNILGLPKNEPETWSVAARLLPSALAAVEREYFGAPPGSTSGPDTAAPITAQPLRKLLADTPEFFKSSRERYERACFVIMPFGRKQVGETVVDFDAVYQEVFAPAISAVELPDGGHLDAIRTDNASFSAAVSTEVFQYLDYSRLVVADVTAPNANVFYELGRRHRARESGTIIVAQKDAVIPFDLMSTRVFRYSRASAAEEAESRAILTDLLKRTLEATIQADR